ncbi:MAG: hypothetical protein KGZ82_05705 [Bacteroidales bacterium]|nr:hypothetical protein [Bacteroidales bacterium]
MITLITGAPGAGKTVQVVAELLQRDTSRPLLVAGIPTLGIPHEVLADPLDWPAIAPDGALIVVDECQSYWRPRSSSMNPPLSIQALETHRHRGIDFILITQSPMLIDPNIRRLVTRHVHVHQTFAGRWRTEWAECQNDPSRLGSGIRSRYVLPKAAMSAYKSAEIHHKPNFKIPLQLYLLPVLLLAVVGGAWYAYSRIKSPPAADVVPASSSVAPESADIDQHQPKRSTLPADFEPRVKTRPESAPAYDEIRIVAAMPNLAGCIASKTRCVCYTHQGTPYPAADSICRYRVFTRDFDPYYRKPENTKDKDVASNNKVKLSPSSVDSFEYPIPEAPASWPKGNPQFQTLPQKL